MRGRGRRVAAAMVAGASLTSAAPARAAVSVCADVLTGKLAVARTELEAKRAALASWREGARLVGEGYTRWEIAWKRRIDCRKLSDGRFQCQAIAQPCTIAQVPPAPEQFQPLPRGK